MLNVHEQFFLLCLHEDKVVVLPNASTGFPQWLGGGVLADLALLGRISINENHRLNLANSEPTGNPLLDETLQKIQGTDGAKKVGYWMDDFDFKPKKVFTQLNKRLLEEEVLKQVDEDYVWVRSSVADIAQAASAKFCLKRQLRSVTLAQVEPDLQVTVLLSLVLASNKLDLVFFKDERKLARRRIDELLMSEAMKNPIGQYIQEIGTSLAARIDED
jgi:Golgi phosphoprotein 3